MAAQVHAEVTLKNGFDDVRRATVDGVVDVATVTLGLPRNVVERLGLQRRGTAFVVYAGERHERPLAGPVSVQIGNRSMVMDCVVGPPPPETLIGQVVLSMLDLVVDGTSGTLRPRHPDYPLLNLRRLPGEAARRSASRHLRYAVALARKIRGVFRFRYRHKSPRVVQVQS